MNNAELQHLNRALSPCPFCGKPAFLRQSEHREKLFFTVGCHDLDCFTAQPMCEWPESELNELIALWERRPAIKSVRMTRKEQVAEAMDRR